MASHLKFHTGKHARYIPRPDAILLLNSRAADDISGPKAHGNITAIRLIPFERAHTLVGEARRLFDIWSDPQSHPVQGGLVSPR